MVRSKINHGKGSSSRKSQTQTPAQDSKLVPWNREPLTDGMKLPVVPSSVFTTIKSTTYPGLISQSSSVPVFGSLPFTAAGIITDYSSLSAVFDQYRLKMVEVVFTPQTTEGIPTTTFGPPRGLFYTVIDYDDVALLSATSQATAYANCIETEVTSPQRRCFIPRMAVGAYSGTVFTGFMNTQPQWIDAASSTVQHFGLKWCVDQGTTSNTIAYDVTVRAVFEWRNSR
jgi:hypothetical protein